MKRHTTYNEVTVQKTFPNENFYPELASTP
jgi:hypothetical protein